jgi:hypothetical protein
MTNPGQHLGRDQSHGLHGLLQAKAGTPEGDVDHADLRCETFPIINVTDSQFVILSLRDARHDSLFLDFNFPPYIHKVRF